VHSHFYRGDGKTRDSTLCTKTDIRAVVDKVQSFKAHSQLHIFTTWHYNCW